MDHKKEQKQAPQVTIISGGYGSNTEVYVDGTLLKNVVQISIGDIKPNSPVIATLTIQGVKLQFNPAITKAKSKQQIIE